MELVGPGSDEIYVREFFDSSRGDWQREGKGRDKEVRSPKNTY
jgi:hypothetical protein